MRGPTSRTRDALAFIAMVSCVSCSSAVQDLGRSGDDPASAPGSGSSASEGFGGAWVDPHAPIGRDLACPVSRPIEGDACSAQNGAPCAYVGAPPPAPDRTSTVTPEDTTTFCICTAERRWSCLQDVKLRTLELPLQDGMRCEDSLSVERRCLPGECVGNVRCRCVAGVARCGS